MNNLITSAVLRCMICRTLMVLCLFVATGACSFAQSTGKLRLQCEPVGSCLYVLDGKHRMKDREVTLMAGPHRFVFWAPERIMLDTSFMVFPDISTEVKVQLHYSQEYISYRHKADAFQRNDRWLRYGPPVLALGAAAWTGVSVARFVKAGKDLDAVQDDYTTSSDPEGIAELKQQTIPSANKEFRDARTMAIVSGGVLAVSLGATYYVRKMLAERKPPVFEDKERVRFDGIVWAPGDTGQGTWAAGLSIPIR